MHIFPAIAVSPGNKRESGLFPFITDGIKRRYLLGSDKTHQFKLTHYRNSASGPVSCYANSRTDPAHKVLVMSWQRYPILTPRRSRPHTSSMCQIRQINSPFDAIFDQSSHRAVYEDPKPQRRGNANVYKSRCKTAD